MIHKGVSRRKALERMFDTTYNLGENAVITRFLKLYIDCEATALKLLRFYHKDRYRRERQATHLNVREIASAAEFFEIAAGRDLIYLLFRGGEGRRHEKTPRQLRNAYVHGKRRADCEEIIAGMDGHAELMSSWLAAVRAFIGADE